MDLDGRGGGEELGEEGRETIVRIYYMREKSIFNKRAKKKIQNYLLSQMLSRKKFPLRKNPQHDLIDYLISAQCFLGMVR